MRQSITFILILTCFQIFSQTLNLPSVHLEELTWMEVQDALENDYKTVIIAAGGTEQNGPHMVLGKHNIRIKYVAERIAIELGNALVAPIVAYVPEGNIDPPKGWMRYPGTIHLPEEHFMKLIEYASRSFKQHGFTDIVLIGDSGGNQNGMKEVSEYLNEEWKATATRVHFVSDFYNGPGIRDSLVAEGIPEEALGRHAGLLDVAYLLAVNPKMIRQNRIAELGRDPDENWKLGFDGDPSLATIEIGKRSISQKIKVSVDQITKLKEENRK